MRPAVEIQSIALVYSDGDFGNKELGVRS